MAGLEQVNYQIYVLLSCLFSFCQQIFTDRHCGEHFVGREGIIHNLIKETNK